MTGKSGCKGKAILQKASRKQIRNFQTDWLYLCPPMDVSIFDNRRVRQGLTVLLLAGSLACIFPPNLPAFQWWANHAALVAMVFLLFGLFFLTINKSRLMFVCLGCSAAICFFKNEMSEKAHLDNHSPARFYPMQKPAQNEMTQDSTLLKPVSPDESSKTR